MLLAPLYDEKNSKVAKMKGPCKIGYSREIFHIFFAYLYRFKSSQVVRNIILESREIFR